MDSSEVAANGDELIYGALDQTGDITDVGAIGLISPRSRGWSIMVRDRTSETFQTPRFRDWIYPTRAEAIDGIGKLFGSQRGE